MPPRDSRSEYEWRMHKVLAHIDAHLDQPLDLPALAAVAHFSPFHFHRLFAAWMNETLGDYVRRRRVEVAALRLETQPRLAVLQVALSVGFGSGEAFSRAFRARFGSAPSVWRAQQRPKRNPGQAQSNPDQAGRHGAAKNGASHHPSFMETAMPDVHLITRAPTLIAYLRRTGPYGAPIGQFWRETVAPWLEVNHLLDRPRFGISHDDPSLTAPAQCRYDACVEVPQDFVASGGFLKTTLPGGRYAALPFKGTSEQIGESWNSLLRDWLPASGFQFDSRPAFEHYPVDAGFDPTTGAFECEICIPVAPL